MCSIERGPPSLKEGDDVMQSLRSDCKPYDDDADGVSIDYVALRP